ncbi:uncharacterized protein PRCAT00006060001 [Priceomyces carsonii]|uniref:uncharacterized protein n=1 Tax=Priceomyces carsonii TaxID=28549 RepID=UPI002ED8E57E|nr:unnamed protein product [Priceomyces carsonii]
MKQQKSIQKIMLDDMGTLHGSEYTLSSDAVTWILPQSIQITENGELYSITAENERYLMLRSLQSCFVQVFPNMSSLHKQLKQPAKRRLNKKTSSNTLENGTGANGTNAFDEPPVIFIKTYDNEKLYVRVSRRPDFIKLISCLIVWQSLKPLGLVKKWYCENKVDRSKVTENPHELLVCRFKIYGPIPKLKNLKVVQGPRAPTYQPSVDTQLDISATGSANAQSNNEINEGWFYTMGVLKSNGVLNFISELDGTLIYSIDIKTIMTSEIREVHHSLFDSSNVLFVGKIKELRSNSVIKSVGPLYKDQNYPSFLVKDAKPIANSQRIFIEFPLHIDLEDWFVGLNYFAKKEYIGEFGRKLKAMKDKLVATPSLSDYSKESLRVSKKIVIDIIEARFDDMLPEHSKGKVYAEVFMWGLSWSRTAMVNWNSNPFWKEQFATDLPILTQMIHIIIKQASNAKVYLSADKVVGTVYVTPDVLSKQLGKNSTIMTEAGFGSSMSLAHSSSCNTLSGSINNDIVRLSIYDSSNIRIGNLMLNVSLKEYHVLAPNNFKPLERMLKNAPMKELIKFCNDNVPSSEFENISLILLDIFQSLSVESEWFKSLMEMELVNVDKMTRKNYISGKRNDKSQAKSSSSNNVFNTLFRGSSIFSKSLERYNLRIGQEYLEKVFGDFFTKIEQEKKNCEVDPRYVKLQESASRLGKSLEDSDLDSDEEYSSDEDLEREAKVKEMTEQNFENLYGYAEEIWNKIYITSNDLPQQIKTQLKNFRTKVELACDPDDRVTALNCLSAFIFLRFFCPAILNPKLFYLTRNHQTGTSQRTLTLIAKILLNLANRQEFSAHKEPHLLKMNSFLEAHQQELLDYFDKITGRKNDFNEKILDLSHEVKRFDLGISNDSTSSELPTTPYLIDKYLRLTELIHLLDLSSISKQLSLQQIATITSQSSTSTINSLNNGISMTNDISKFGTEEFKIDQEKSVYQIGSLEFEKSEFLDLAGDNETEGFIKSLCGNDENIFSFIDSNVTLKDIQKVSTTLTNKIKNLEDFLDNPEVPSNYDDPDIWNAFVSDVLSRCYIDLSRNNLVYLERDMAVPSFYKVVGDSVFAYLKLKFSMNSAENHLSNDIDSNQVVISSGLISRSMSSNALGSVLKGSSKNPFRKWMRKS